MEKMKEVFERYVLDYLNREFMVRDNSVYSNTDKDKRWAYDVFTEIVDVYGFTKEEITDVIKNWVETRGVDWDKWNTLRKIKVSWTPELVNDINAYHGIDAEAELTGLLAAQLAQDLDSKIIQGIRNMAELEANMKRRGYTTQVCYNPNSFLPRHIFVPDESQ